VPALCRGPTLKLGPYATCNPSFFSPNGLGPLYPLHPSLGLYKVELCGSPVPCPKSWPDPLKHGPHGPCSPPSKPSHRPEVWALLLCIVAAFLLFFPKKRPEPLNPLHPTLGLYKLELCVSPVPWSSSWPNRPKLGPLPPATLLQNPAPSLRSGPWGRKPGPWPPQPPAPRHWACTNWRSVSVLRLGPDLGLTPLNSGPLGHETKPCSRPWPINMPPGPQHWACAPWDRQAPHQKKSCLPTTNPDPLPQNPTPGLNSGHWGKESKPGT
jgi:hypothetical protein